MIADFDGLGVNEERSEIHKVVPPGCRTGLSIRKMRTRSHIYYDDGNGVPQSSEEATEWPKLAAQQRAPRTLYLEFMHHTGDGMLENSVLALCIPCSYHHFSHP